MPLTCPSLNFSLLFSARTLFLYLFSLLFLWLLPWVVFVFIYLVCAKFSLNFWGPQNSCAACPGLEIHISIYLSVFPGVFPALFSGWCPVINTSSGRGVGSGWCGFNEQMISIFMGPLSRKKTRKVLWSEEWKYSRVLLSWENLIVGIFPLFSICPPFVCHCTDKGRW